MIMTLEHKPFEIFSGTGGVGKTTLATSRAIHLAQAGKKVLLITIDPAKRLKELLNIKDSHAGEVVTVKDPFNEEKDLKLDVELMSAPSTFERMAIKNNCEEVLNNRILSILTKPYGGLNEILAIVELNLKFERNIYDVIVLDTPPGSHFLDFLDSVSRIQMFFDQSFVDIFTYLGKKVESSQTANFGKKMMNKVLSSGVKKLLKYLGKVTGDQFVDDFIDAILAIYKTKSSFLDAINLQEKLKSKDIKGKSDAGFVAPMAAGVLAALEKDQEGIDAYKVLYEQRLRILSGILENCGMRLAIKPRAGFYTLWETPRRAFGQPDLDQCSPSQMSIRTQ